MSHTSGGAIEYNITGIYSKMHVASIEIVYFDHPIVQEHNNLDQISVSK